jgi:NAD(P)-dependent dehydrogenase (short-subunit alcohol dehydrogenase family)
MARHVVVTGAASGIGAAVVTELARAGDRVTALDLNPAPGADTSITCDLSDPTSIDAAVAQLSGVDALLNVAGVPGTLPDEVVFAVNFLGLRHLTEALLPQISDGGAVVNVASIAGMTHTVNASLHKELLLTATGFEDGAKALAASKPEGFPAYNFTKEAVILYTGLIAARQWSRGVRVNAVSPGPVETPILPAFEDSMGKDVIEGARAVAGRHGTVADIAPVVTFLASPAAAWINGQNLIADGGLIALGQTMAALA